MSITKHEGSAVQTPQELLADLRAIVSEAEKILGESTQRHSETQHEALRERYEAAQAQLSRFYRDAKDRAVAGVKYTDQTIRSHPYESIAIAAGIGLFAGWLYGRRQH